MQTKYIIRSQNITTKIEKSERTKVEKEGFNVSKAFNKKIDPEESKISSLLKLAHSIDQFEQYTRPHASQMAHLAETLALRVGISGVDLDAIKLAALLHDIGELSIDWPGVRSSGNLDFNFRIELWRHPIIGEQLLAKRGLSRQAQLLVRWHHEWWNGYGYPDMLAGEAIPVGARILRIVDSYNALTGWRPYREAYSEIEAEEIIAASAGIEFDPYLVKTLLEMTAESRKLYEAVEKPPAENVTLEVAPTEDGKTVEQGVYQESSQLDITVDALSETSLTNNFTASTESEETSDQGSSLQEFEFQQLETTHQEMQEIEFIEIGEESSEPALISSTEQSYSQTEDEQALDFADQTFKKSRENEKKEERDVEDTDLQ